MITDYGMHIQPVSLITADNLSLMKSWESSFSSRGLNFIILKSGSLDNAIQEFSLA
jgi:hypothetical protein